MNCNIHIFLDYFQNKTFVFVYKAYRKKRFKLGFNFVCVNNSKFFEYIAKLSFFTFPN